MLQANLRCQWYARCCAVLAWQGRACRKQLVADILSPCANHSHFELQSLILQSLSNYVGANYCSYIKPAFSHRSFFPWKKKSYLCEILDTFYSWLLSAMDPHPKEEELVAIGSQWSEDAVLTLYCCFTQSFTDQQYILIYSLLKLYQTCQSEMRITQV